MFTALLSHFWACDVGVCCLVFCICDFDVAVCDLYLCPLSGIKYVCECLEEG